MKSIRHAVEGGTRNVQQSLHKAERGLNYCSDCPIEGGLVCGDWKFDVGCRWESGLWWTKTSTDRAHGGLKKGVPHKERDQRSACGGSVRGVLILTDTKRWECVGGVGRLEGAPQTADGGESRRSGEIDKSQKERRMGRSGRRTRSINHTRHEGAGGGSHKRRLHKRPCAGCMLESKTPRHDDFDCGVGVRD